MPNDVRLTGKVRVWDVNPEFPREFIEVTLPYGVARRVVKAEPFRATTGRGEQREVAPAHAKRLAGAMEDGTYTPTPIAVGLRPRHRKGLAVKDGVATLTLADGDHLPSLDGNHRMTGLEELRAAADKAGDRVFVDRVDRQPVTVVVHLNGDTQQDFVRLQAGRAVDAAHMLSMRVRHGLLGGARQGPAEAAVEAARALNDTNGSPFQKQVRFDSCGLYPIPITTLCAAGSSDQATSLVGLAKVCKGLPAAKMAAFVTEVVRALREDAPELVAGGMPLTPPPDGTKGSATMLIGVATCV